jgi:hypothetical protein
MPIASTIHSEIPSEGVLVLHNFILQWRKNIAGIPVLPLTQEPKCKVQMTTTGKT